MKQPARFEALGAGAAAGRARQPVTACPHSTTGPDAHLAAAWVRGHVAASPDAYSKVDYGG